jgi:hypothetical protein
MYGSQWSEDLVAAVEESPLLETVAREQLVKTQQAGKDLACAVVICGDYRWRCNYLYLRDGV